MPMTKETEKKDLLKNEESILSGMMEAASYKNDGSLDKHIDVRRNGKILFGFNIRPISEETLYTCRKKATKQVPNPAGRQFPPIDGDTDTAKLRAYKIYYATVPEDRKKTWENTEMKKFVNTANAVDVIDSCLLAGEKDTICDIIDELSGFGTAKEDYLKNSSEQEENSI